MKQFLTENKDHIVTIVSAIVTGTGYYFYLVMYEGRKFSMFHLLGHMFIAFSVGVMMYMILPDSMGAEKGGVIALSGFLSTMIMSYISKNGENIVGKIINKKKDV